MIQRQYNPPRIGPINHRRPPTRDVLLSVSAGWHAHVDVLEAKLAGTKPGPHWDNWVRLRSEYDGLVLRKDKP